MMSQHQAGNEGAESLFDDSHWFLLKQKNSEPVSPFEGSVMRECD
jgi:hypothetical protein